MADGTKKTLSQATPEVLEAYLANPGARSRLAQAMVEPIRRRRYGGPWEVCPKCGKPHWEPDDASKHFDDECAVYAVMES